MPDEERPQAEDDQAQPEGDQTADAELSGPDFPVVGIGASAGGLEALRELFKAMPTDTGMAFVVIQHLDPTHESHMASLLQSQTDIPVVEVDEAMALKPDHVYMILPDWDLAMEGERLVLRKPTEPRHKRRPVDVFLQSLAEHQGERAIGVILSGTGSNGTPGLQVIKAYGGMCIAQDPRTAGHTGMPQSAIDAGVADSVLAVERMPETLVEYARHPYVRQRVSEQASSDEAAQQIDSILSLLLARTDQDFRSYKKSTLARRIYRRMGLSRIEQLDRYADYLRENQDEIETLVRDLRIGVTAFFRDPEAWQALREKVIEPMIEHCDPGASIRVWVPGCASGEEAYSLAIQLFEQAEAAGKHHDLQIFASDIAEASLQTGRSGWFPESIAKDLTQQRLDRFFKRQGDGYRVSQRLRDAVTFASHDLLHDPPFSRLDLVSCRNLLIYLESDVQRKVLSLLHFSLREGGYLFLGSAETIGRQSELFQPIDEKHRIYQSVGTKHRDLIDLPVFGPRGRAVGQDEAAPAEQSATKRHRPAELAERTLLAQYAPASVLVDAHHHIQYFHGPTERYLTQPGGEPTHNLLDMARQGIATRLRSVLHNANTNGEPVTVTGRVQRGEQHQPIRITVTPVKRRTDEPDMLLVSFQDDQPADVTTEQSEAERSGDEAQRAPEQQLEEELRSTRQELQSSIEEMETSNEELKASNEEVTSMNEELQSTNEELESSKEELQSLNEELNTVNNQLRSKVDDLERANNDLSNLLASTDVATLHLDNEFRIRWFTRSAQELLEAIDADVGRPISQLADKFTESHLLEDAQAVLDKLASRERLVQSSDERWYRRRIQPYRTQDNRIEGVVVIFADVTELKQREQQLETLNRDLEQRVNDRTAELKQTADRLRALTAELNNAEQRERRRLAETLHDDLQQLLVAAKMSIDMAKRTIEDQQARDQLEDATGHIDQTIDGMRTLAGELSPPILYNQGLAPTLQWLARELKNKHGLHVELHADNVQASLSEDLRVFVYRAVRELALNVVKHANTDHARISVGDSQDHHLKITVADDGKGCDADQLLQSNKGFGLMNIRERLYGLGGDFDVQPNSADSGCRITMQIPLGSKSPDRSRP